MAWLMRPAVLLPKPGRRAFRLAARVSRRPMQGFYPDAAPEAPGSNVWHRWSPVASQILPRQNAYKMARQLSDAMLESLDRLLPGWSVFGGLDFRFVLRFHIQFFLANHSLPFLYACFLQLEPHRRVMLIDSHFTPELAQRFLERQGLPAFNTLQCRSTFSLNRLKRKCDQWHALPDPPLALTKQPVGGTLAVVPHAIHLEILSPALQILAEQGPVHLLAAHSRVDLNAFSIGKTLALPVLSRGPFIRQAVHHFDVLHATLKTMPAADQEFCLNQLDLLSDLVEKYAVFSDTVEALQPEIVIGCLEYNTYGALASLHKQRQHFRLINIQHGFVSPTWSMDALGFDDYFVWNRKTAELALEDGFYSPGACQVVGNSRWELLARDMQKPASSALTDLQAWKGEHRLIGAYTQCLQAFSTISVKQGFIQALLAYLHQHPEVRLLIKKHPLEQDTIVDEMVRASGLSGRIQVMTADHISLAESFKSVNVVTTVFSAVLLEALAIGKPVAAIDFAHTIAVQDIPIPATIPVLTTQTDVNRWLDRSLLESEVIVDKTVEKPVLHAEPYEARLRQLLQSRA
jgi:hypothetical protein